MPKTRSHGTESGRARASERTAARVIAWVNEPSEDGPRNRIRALLRDIRFLLDAWELVEDDEGGGWCIQRVKEKRASQAWRRISRLFRRYSFFPFLMPFGPSLIQQWAPIRGPFGKFKGKWPPIAGRYTDNQAIFELTWLMPSDIGRIRECVCGKWLYSKFSHQKFCSAKCREKAFRSSPEWMEYRRNKAREYYWLHKNKNVK
jgi:hypothetical protein